MNEHNEREKGKRERKGERKKTHRNLLLRVVLLELSRRLNARRTSADNEDRSSLRNVRLVASESLLDILEGNGVNGSVGLRSIVGSGGDDEDVVGDVGRGETAAGCSYGRRRLSTRR